MRHIAARSMAAALAVAAVLAGCTSTPAKDAASAPPPPMTLKSQTVPASKIVDLGGGARVVFSDAPSSGSTLQVSTSNAPATPDDWDSLATPVHLEVRNGSLGSGATLEFPLPDSVPQDAATVGIATWDETRRQWTPVTARVDRARGVVTAFTTHFSWWQPFSWDWTSIGAWVNQNVGEIIGKRAPAPSCRSGPPGWVAQLVGVESSDALAVRACAQRERETLDVQLVNNRPYGMILTYGAGVKWGWHSGGDSATDAGLYAIADTLVGHNELYLPAKGRASVGIPAIPAGTMRQFHIGVDARTLLLDTLAVTAGPLVEKGGKALGAPLLAACGSYLAGFTRPDAWSSGDDFRSVIAGAGPCVQEAFLKLVAKGVLDEHQVVELAASLGQIKRANLVGTLLTAYDVEWKLLDLWVDRYAAPGAAGLGQGFSVRARAAAQREAPPSAPATTPSAPAPAPPPPTTDGSLTVTLNAATFPCDGTSHSLGQLSGATAGERVTFTSSTEPGLLPGSANSSGVVALRWLCKPGQGGTRWQVAARGQSSARTATFTVIGANPAPTPPLPPTPPVTRGLVVEDSFLGGTWARRDPGDGTWYSAGNRPSNAAYWFTNGLGVAVDCTRSAAGYTVHFANGTAQAWSWWAHVTDNTWVPVAVFREVTSDGGQGLATC